MSYLIAAGMVLSLVFGSAYSADAKVDENSDQSEETKSESEKFKSSDNQRMFNQKIDNNRIERVMYDDNKVVKISAIVNHPFLIEFKPDEPIEDIAGGEIAGWDVQKKGYRLYVRALEKAEDTTLIVSSRKRSYVFDLIRAKATPKNLDQRPSKIVFNYPAPPAPPPKPVVIVAPPPPPPPPPPEPPVRRNENYSMQIVSESVDIRPREVYDDGRFTWMKFPANGEIPAIYKSTPKVKEEILIGSHMEGEYVVMHGIAPLWNLRLAGSMIGVFNESYDEFGVGPKNGTTVHGLVREIKK